MWLIVILMLVFAILDKTRVLQCNTLFMSVLYILSIPFLVCIYAALLISNIIRLIESFTVMRCVSAGFSVMVALPIVIILVAALYKLCRTPIDPDRWNGRGDYDIACAKRQRTLLWVAYPLTWVCMAAAFGVGIYLVVIIAGYSLLAMNPIFWFFCLITLGLVFAAYVVVVVSAASVYLTAFLIFSSAAAVFIIVTIAITITLLWRMRGKLGYSKGRNVVTVISMLIPVWSLITMIGLTRDINKASKLAA